MLRLSSLVPSLDTVIIQYIREGLGSFVRGSFLSAAVMIGAASEKEIYQLAESLVGALKDPAAKTKLTNQINAGRSLYQLLEMIRKHIEACQRLRGDFDGALAHLSLLFEAIRVQRNYAVHLSTGTVNEASVRLSYEVFPHAAEKAEKLRAWFGTNPNSLEAKQIAADHEQKPHSDKTCQLNRSMQHSLSGRSDNTSHRESICTSVLNQNSNRAFVLFELTPAHEISFLDPYQRTSGRLLVIVIPGHAQQVSRAVRVRLGLSG
jgi:hypothetical protein